MSNSMDYMNGQSPQQQDNPDDGEVSFDMLDKEAQNSLIRYVMQGKPQTPQNMNSARQMLSSDPDTVRELCEKLGIDDGHAGDDDGE